MSSLGWLDIHGHFQVPIKDEAKRQAAVQQMRQNNFLVASDWSWSIQDTIASMDANGVQMQMLSNLPATTEALQASNDFLAEQVRQYPHRLGLLAALPTDDIPGCLAEINRSSDLQADGFAVTTVRKGISLADPSLDPIWTKLDSLRAVVFCHPNAYAPPKDGLPTPLIEAPFDTCRAIVAMMYRKVFLRFRHICFVMSHAAGAFPALTGRLRLLGTESWVPGAAEITADELEEQIRLLWVDVAASAETGMGPAFRMRGDGSQIVYGSDCGVPCSTSRTMERNRLATMEVEKSLGMETGRVGRNGWDLFPGAAQRVRGHRETQAWFRSCSR